MSSHYFIKFIIDKELLILEINYYTINFQQIQLFSPGNNKAARKPL